MNQLLLFGVLEPLSPTVRRKCEQSDQRHHQQKHYNEEEEGHEGFLYL